MASNLISSLLSLCSNLLPSIRASLLQAPSSSSSSSSSSKYSQNGGAAEEDLERMMRTLEFIKATLYDAEEREIRDRSVKLWFKELKKVAYAAEDLLSEYRYEATRVQVESRKASEASGSHKRKEMECIVPIPDSIMEQLSKIRKRLDEIVKDRENLQLKESDGARHLNNRNLRPPTGHMVDESSIFGREAETMEVMDLLLLEKEKPFFVIAIIGKGGLGKTTIAQLVYKDAKISRTRCFDSFGWVCVSEEFDIRNLIKATIVSITKKNCGLSELSLLQEELAKIVKGKKIFIVLDDVWNENECFWELFRIPFKEAQFVRILVTTREKKYVKFMQTMTSFKPSYLSEESCWKLFEHYAFGDTSYIVPTEYVKMGKAIMKKCGGLPLAVKSIASLLRQTTDEESWSEILKSDLWESNPSNEVFSALQISYAHLPTNLKPCFLFCSMYRKDHKFKKMKLIELWVSHGYIVPQGRKQIMEIGIEYYEELKERSFLEDLSDKFCKLHDIIYDLARLNSDNEHYSVDNQLLDIHEEKVLQEAYHLYATGSMEYINQLTEQNLKGLRTLSLNLTDRSGALEHQCWFRPLKEYHPSQSWKRDHHNLCMENTIIFDFTRFKALKVLELKGDRVSEIPDSIKELKNLTYFRIISDHLQTLPLSLGLLYNLQIFIVDCWNSPLEYLPESIGYLLNLRYMSIKCSNIKKIPVTLCSLGNLQRLVIKITDILEELPSDVGQLGNLREIKIHYRKMTKPLSGKSHFHFMGALSDLLVGIANCSQLKTLKVSGCFVNFNPQGLINFPAMRTMAACLRVKTIGWLKNMKDLEGDLIIEGLENMSNLVDAQNVNLRNKSRIKTLDLCWHDRKHKHRGCLRICTIPKDLTIRLIKESDKVIPVGGDFNCGLLEFLQPHPQLKKLVLRGYPSETVPNWMGDTLSLQAIQEIILQDCNGLQFLPFRNLQTLKHVRILWCSGFRVIQLEQLPTQLETLEIIWCKHLELITGEGNLGMLISLKVSSCTALKSITIDGPESTETFGNSSHQVQHNGQQCTLPLTVLNIRHCPLLNALPRIRHLLDRS